jgi:hypothetical protein
MDHLFAMNHVQQHKRLDSLNLILVKGKQAKTLDLRAIKYHGLDNQNERDAFWKRYLKNAYESTNSRVQT